MDPSFVLVDFNGQPPPAGWRDTLDTINANIGGAPPVPGHHTVDIGNNEPIQFMDPVNLNNPGHLLVNNKGNADYVAGQINAVHHLFSWGLETNSGAVYR